MGVRLFTACFVFALISLAVVKVTGRPVRYTSPPDELVSDGIDQEKHFSSYLVLNGMVDFTDKCEHMYGFLPCSESPLGHLFLILVYEYLLFHGESYVASGGERIFKILGPGVFGASAFQILGALPESLILLASGLLNDAEKAQEYASTGVGLLAGTTIFMLTVVWGTCLIIGSTQDPSNSSNLSQSQIQRLVSKLNGYGVTTDAETSYTARIMVLSVIPFLIILIPKIFQISSFGEHIIIIIALIVSVLFLLSYFFYQTFEPWIQKRRLEYVEHEHLVVDILIHLQELTEGRLLTEDGAPSVPVIRRLFEKIDQDGDKFILFSELKALLYEIRVRNSHWDKDKKLLAELMNEFDPDGDKKITMDEFVEVFTKWLGDIKRTMDKQYHSVKSLKDRYKIFQPWIQKKRKEHEIKQLMSEIIGHVQRSALGTLFAEDGTPDISAVKRLFESSDLDGDNCISQEELKELMVKINLGQIPPWDADEIVRKIMEELDANEDHVINEEEFIFGFLKWLNNNQAPNSTESEDDDMYQKKWDEIDMLVKEENNIKKSVWAWTKAIMLLVLGIVMLALLAEPLIQSVHDFSISANVPPFFISFMLVPLATNARGAISAIKAASRKKARTTSLTFSEIYGGVFMNNLLGFSVLLSLIYFCGLSWRFSAEVLIVLIVCVVTGFTASFNSTFPVWKSFVAYLLYPLSLLLVYVMHR